MTSIFRVAGFFTMVVFCFGTGLSSAVPTQTIDQQIDSASATLAQNLEAMQAEQADFSQRQAVERTRIAQMTLQVPATPAGYVLGEGSLIWLSGRDDPALTGIQPIASRAGLLVSFDIPASDPQAFLRGRSWTYDDAIGAISFLLQGNTADARSVLTSLKGLMAADGSLGFSYQVDSTYKDSRVRSGTLAWVGYAMALYQRVTGDKRFESSAMKIAQKLKGLQTSSGSLRGGPDVAWISTEHNVDAYFFFREFYRVTGKGTYLTTATQIKDSLLNNHWTGDAGGHFRQGIGDDAAALDANALGALFLNAIGRADLAQSALNYVESVFSNQQTISGSAQAITGYSPDAARQTVWVEGTLTAAVAYYRVGNTAKTNSILQNVGLIQDVRTAQGTWNGALPFAVTRYVNPDGDTYAEWNSVSTVSWLLLNTALQNGDARFMNQD